MEVRRWPRDVTEMTLRLASLYTAREFLFFLFLEVRKDGREGRNEVIERQQVRQSILDRSGRNLWFFELSPLVPISPSPLISHTVFAVSLQKFLLND